MAVMRRFRETDALVREYAKEGGAMEVMQLSAVSGACMPPWREPRGKS